MRILLANAYSALNAGDGLLVRRAVDLVHEAWPEEDLDLVVAASHPESFAADPGLLAIHPIRGRRPIVVAVAGLSAFAAPTAGRHGLSDAFRESLSRSDLVVSVGGGYLRQPTLRGGVASMAVHGAQLRAIARSSKPWVLLPQSIGPLVGRPGEAVRSALAAARTVWVRDDRSLAEVGGGARVRRAPDMALLAMADGLPTPAAGTAPVGVVIRPLDHPRDYEDRLGRMLADLPTVEGLVQSSHSANDDRPFTRGFGLSTRRSLREALGSDLRHRPAAVVSVRLHGALESILAGVPAVHLGYERKAWGAYGDVGLGAFLHAARGFDPRAVSRQALDLADDPSPFWAALSTGTGRLADARAEVLASVRDAVEGGPR